MLQVCPPSVQALFLWFLDCFFQRECSIFRFFAPSLSIFVQLSLHCCHFISVWLWICLNQAIDVARGCVRMTPPVRIDRRGIGLDSIGDARGDEFTTDSIDFETTASFLDGLFRNLSASMRRDVSVSSKRFLTKNGSSRFGTTLGS